MRKNGFVLVLLILSVFFLGISSSRAACSYSIELADPGYGDGWNGGRVSVFVNATAVLSNLTLASGYGPETHYFDVETGDVISTDYTGGAWSYENHYAIFDADGALVAETGHPNGTPHDLADIIAACQPIPTLSEWGMIILTLLLSCSFVWINFRQRCYGSRHKV